MKVLCIKKAIAKYNHPDLLKAIQKIVIGEAYTVVDESDGMYELAEFPHPLQILWEAECFIPLSDISETEMERDYNKVTQ